MSETLGIHPELGTPVVLNDGIAFILTDCCGATATGSTMCENTGVACRACYAEIHEAFGMAWLAGTAEYERMREGLIHV